MAESNQSMNGHSAISPHSAPIPPLIPSTPLYPSESMKVKALRHSGFLSNLPISWNRNSKRQKALTTASREKAAKNCAKKKLNETMLMVVKGKRICGGGFNHSDEKAGKVLSLRRRLSIPPVSSLFKTCRQNQTVVCGARCYTITIQIFQMLARCDTVYTQYTLYKYNCIL